MVRCKVGPDDRRSILLQRTVKGAIFLREFGKLVVGAAQGVCEVYESGLPQKY